MSSIKLKTYTVSDNNENIENLEYNFKLDIKIIDMKKEILKKSFDNKYNYLELFNITESIYKDFGKLFFDKGLLPNTLDNYKLSEFTNADRVFSFIITGKNIEHKDKKINENEKKKESYFIGKTKKNVLIFDDENFPPLC